MYCSTVTQEQAAPTTSSRSVGRPGDVAGIASERATGSSHDDWQIWESWRVHRDHWPAGRLHFALVPGTYHFVQYLMYTTVPIIPHGSGDVARGVWAPPSTLVLGSVAFLEAKTSFSVGQLERRPKHNDSGVMCISGEMLNGDNIC